MPAAQTGTPVQIANYSRDEDPAAAERATKTVAAAMSQSPSNGIWCKPGCEYDRWYGVVHNYLLSTPSKKMIFSTPGAECVAIAYWYGEEEAQKARQSDPQSPPPSPPGSIDLAQYARPGNEALRDQLMVFLKEGKLALYQKSGRFMYLAFLSVQPEQQGNGLGGAMVAHLAQLADEQGAWCYLEASNTNNARLYARHGYMEVAKSPLWKHPEDDSPDAQLQLIAMARPPKAGQVEQ